MTIVPNVRILAAMGRSFHGLVVAAALAAGCAAAATPESVTQSTGDSDLGGGSYDFAGGVVVSNCTDGGSCSTGSPGDCSMGHAVCSGNVQSCVPDVTTQRCYDGPAGTVNKGVCKAGTQTCIGSLGSCDGEVKPAAVENCFNDLDDDCDGVVNNGGPTTISTGTPHALTEIRVAAAPSRRRVLVPLSAACPHLSRALFDALAAPRTLADDATPLVAPWLERRTRERFDGGRRALGTSFGGVAVEDEDVALLDRLRGESLGALALSSTTRERLCVMIERGHVILR